MIFPSVTGRRFQKRICFAEITAPNIIPDGKTNMFTTECSKPSAKKVIIGSHIATIFPTVERETSASSAPIVTIQLQRTPFTSARTQPLPPRAAKPSVFFCAACLKRSETAPPFPVRQFVIARKKSPAYSKLPIKLPRYTHPQLRRSLVKRTVPASTPAGSKAKLPVTNSSPSSTRITKPAGKRIAPTMGGSPCDVTRNASEVAYPRKAPESAPRISMSGTESSDFFFANCTVSCKSSVGLTWSVIYGFSVMTQVQFARSEDAILRGECQEASPAVAAAANKGSLKAACSLASFS